MPCIMAADASQVYACACNRHNAFIRFLACYVYRLRKLYTPWPTGVFNNIKACVHEHSRLYILHIPPAGVRNAAVHCVRTQIVLRACLYN
jgi:hypothetical protein